MIDWHTLQVEHAEWTHENFGAQSAHQPLLGLVEETGELEIAFSEEEKIDAVADCMIYWVGLCTSMGFDADTLIDRAHANHLEPTATFQRTLGVLAHYVLKLEQNIRQERAERNREIARSALEDYARLVGKAAGLLEVDFDSAVQNTWNAVKKRNWKKNPNTGEAT